jgi:hypothetical protein
VKKSFNIQELLHPNYKCHGTRPMHPSLLRAFQSYQKHNLKHPSSMDLIITKQNKLPSFIDRYKERGENISTNAQYVALHWKSWMRFINKSTSGTKVG